MTRIDRISVEPLDHELREPFEISLGTREKARNLVVTVETDSGVVGHGEGSPLPPVTGETQAAAVATARSVTSMLEGAPLADYRELVGEVRAAVPGAVSALFAVETALLDAYCRDRGIPLSELFGGAPASVTTDITVPIVTPDAAAERATRAATAGFDHIKVKAGGEVDADVARTVAVADAAPDATITVDANQLDAEGRSDVCRRGDRGRGRPRPGRTADAERRHPRSRESARQTPGSRRRGRGRVHAG